MEKTEKHVKAAEYIKLYQQLNTEQKKDALNELQAAVGLDTVKLKSLSKRVK